MAKGDDLLEVLPSDTRRALLSRAERRVHHAGDVLVQQGSVPRSLFRIHSGFARVHREHLGSRVEVYRMEPGYWFGELSLLDGAPASATVRAETRVEVDRLSEAALASFVAENPDVGAAFYRAVALTLARRLRHMTAVIPERLFERGSAATLLDRASAPGYLDATEYCDFEHPSIRALAAELERAAQNESDLARRAFYFVRDEITYTLGLSADPASTTLSSKRGSCSHKANLFVAIMRACGIPAGYHFMFVKTRDYLGPIVIDRFRQFMSHRSLHVLPAVLIGDRWVRCDPSDDARMSEQTAHLNPPSQKIEFDGVRDAMLHLSPDSIDYYDGTCWPNIDAVLARVPRIPAVVLTVLNEGLDWARRFGAEYRDVSTAADAFFSWLRQALPETYHEFEMIEAMLNAEPPAAQETSCRK